MLEELTIFEGEKIEDDTPGLRDDFKAELREFN